MLTDLRMLLAWCRHPLLLPPVVVPTTDQQMEALDDAQSDEAGEANPLSDINHNSVLLSKLRALRTGVINHGMSSSIPTFALDCCSIAPLATNSDLLDSFVIEISAGSFSMGNAKLCAPAVLNSFSSVLGPVFSAVVCVPILIYLSQDINVNIVSYSAAIIGSVIVVLCKSDDPNLPTPENSIYDGELGPIPAQLKLSRSVQGAAEILFSLSKNESDQVRCAIINQSLPVMLGQSGVARCLGLHLYHLMLGDSSDHVLHLSLKNTRAVFSEPFPADYPHISAEVVAQQWVRVVQRILPHPGVEEALISVRLSSPTPTPTPTPPSASLSHVPPPLPPNQVCSCLPLILRCLDTNHVAATSVLVSLLPLFSRDLRAPVRSALALAFPAMIDAWYAHLLLCTLHCIAFVGASAAPACCLLPQC